MKRPLLVLAVGYIIGIVWGLYCNCSIALLYTILIPIFFLTRFFLKPKKQLKIFSIRRYFRYIKLFLKLSTIVTIIISSLISNSIIIYQNKKYNNMFNNVNDVNIIGIIISNKNEKEYNDVYKIRVQSLNENTMYKDTNLLINIKKNKNYNLKYGDKVIVKGEFKNPTTQRNYKGFNYKEYLKTQKVYGTVNTTSVKTVERNCINRVFIIFNSIHMCIRNNLKIGLPEKYANLLNAIMLGDTNELDPNMVENFRDSNIAHVLAVSGMHISYIILVITKVLSNFLGKRKSKFVTIFILGIFMFITDFSPSVLRATITGGMFLLSKVIYKKSDIWSSLSLSILCTLLYNPFLILNSGLLLSYCGVIGIIVFNKNICNALNRIKVKNTKYKYRIKKFEKLIKYIKETLSISISVQLMILPIIINNFNTIGLVFLITSLLLSIIIGPIMLLGFFAILTSISFLWLFNIIKYPIILFLQLLILISTLGSNLSFNKIYIRTLNIWEITIYYIFIFLINIIFSIYKAKEPSSFEYRIRNIISLIKIFIRMNKKRVISFFLIVCILFSVIKTIPKKLQIHFIDVGQGDSTLIISPMRKNILIDGGGSLKDSFDVGKSILIPYLLDRGITKIDYIIITHMDQDHVRSGY